MNALRVLVVDDMRDAADTLALVLRSYGHQVEVAYDGARAIARARALRPHAVILDLGMPPPDGIAACRAMRAEPWCAATCMLALTGSGEPHDRERTRGAGFDHHLVKPADFQALLAILESLRPARETPARIRAGCP